METKPTIVVVCVYVTSAEWFTSSALSLSHAPPSKPGLMSDLGKLGLMLPKYEAPNLFSSATTSPPPPKHGNITQRGRDHHR